jgi:glutathione S-transferase
MSPRLDSMADSTHDGGWTLNGAKMADLVLYHASPSRSSTALWMLEEVGQPYEIQLLDLQRGDQRKPDFLAINLMGKVPALRHNGATITECAAICCYLAERFPEAGLTIPIDSPHRGPYLKWLFFGPSCIEPAMIDRMGDRPPPPPQAAGWGDFDRIVTVLRNALAGNEYLVAGRFTAADIIIGSTLRWGLMFKLLPEHPEFRAYVERLEQRPAVQRALAKDKELSPGNTG